MTGEVAGLLDPICRAEITRIRAADPGWRRLLDDLAAGPASIDDLRVELRLKRQELSALRAPLERCGAIIARSLQVTAGEGHQHSCVLVRWDQAHPVPGTSRSEVYPAGAGADGSVCHRPNSLPCGSRQVTNQPMPGTGPGWSASPPSSLTRAAPALMSSTSK